MTAFLSIHELRAHLAPATFQSLFDGLVPAARLPAQPPRRRALAAEWAIAPDGTLTCRWHTGASAPSAPPPH